MFLKEVPTATLRAAIKVVCIVRGCALAIVRVSRRLSSPAVKAQAEDLWKELSRRLWLSAGLFRGFLKNVLGPAKTYKMGLS